METQIDQFTSALETNAPQFSIELLPKDLQLLGDYYGLLLKWNPRLHLVAPCSPEEFAVKHVLESLMLLKHLPANARVADVGTGAGLPLIPCLLVRNDLHGLLIESSSRKAVFLREALRPVRPPNRASLTITRFEDLPSPDVEFVTCRALDRFSESLPKLIGWAAANTTFLLFGGSSLVEQLKALLVVNSVQLMPQSQNRFLVAGRANPS